MNKFKYIILSFLTFLIVCTSCEEYVKDIPPSEIFLNMPEGGYEINVNDTIVIIPRITYDFNSTYAWVLNEEIIWDEKDYQLIPNELNKYTYHFSINNDRGSDDTTIVVQSMYKTDFEEFELEKDTFWLNTETNNSLISDQIEFDISGSYNNQPWYGFTYSNLTGSDKYEDNEKYSCHKASSDFESTIFGIMLLDKNPQNAITLNTKDGSNHLFKSISVNNSYYLYDAVNTGAHGSKKFGGEDGTDLDWLKLIIVGIDNNDTKQGTIEFMLADFTFGTNRDNYIVEDWTTIDLTTLGHVNTIKFYLSSSDTVDGVTNSPGFVCFDEIKIIE
ncbi:DUF4465 domain-containing protein [Labilibacter marinus]|uniref:DUF4465 domain-containing protein n=1 Tax=Labilibacter marinus TaxID=1477105 RepID=UPI00082CCC1F|nr:DUF4465 domain-containing protein [Labilibacter marinus]